MVRPEAVRPNALSFSASRRRALLAAIAGGGSSFAGLGPTLAQNATPAGEGEPVSLLLVQWCESGRAEPVAGDPGSYTLTLGHASGKTLYFSDRPERMAGLFDTAALLSDKAFFNGDPPNAALAVDDVDGGAGVTTLELMSGEFDPATGSLTYLVALLPLTAEEPAGTPSGGDIELPAAFGNSWLFVDTYRYHTGSIKKVNPDIVITN